MIDDENDIDDETDISQLDDLLAEFQRLHLLLVPNDPSRLQIVGEFNPDKVQVYWIQGKGRKRKSGKMYGWGGYIADVCETIKQEIEITKSLLDERGIDY